MQASPQQHIARNSFHLMTQGGLVPQNPQPWTNAIDLQGTVQNLNPAIPVIRPVHGHTYQSSATSLAYMFGR